MQKTAQNQSLAQVFVVSVLETKLRGYRRYGFVDAKITTRTTDRRCHIERQPGNLGLSRRALGPCPDRALRQTLVFSHGALLMISASLNQPRCGALSAFRERYYLSWILPI